MNNTEIDIPQMVGLKPIEKSLSDQEGKPDCCASENNHASKQTATIQDTCVPERDTCSPPLSLLPTSPPVVSSSPPVAEDDIPLNESITKTNSDVPIKVFYSSLVEALNTKKGLPAINNEECLDNDMLSESEGLTSKPTKVSSTSKKISRTRKSKNLAEVQKSKPVLNSEKIISDIITSCDRHIFGQTSSIQTILNTCSQIMSIAGCEKFGNDIMDVCSQILSDAYKNGQNIIDLCKRLSKWQSKVDVMQETTSKMKKTNRKTAKKNGIISKSKPIVKVEVEEDVALDELPLISDSEDELNQVDDPDWTSYWAKKNNAKPQVNDDQDDGNDSLRKKQQMTEDDTEWVPEPEEDTKSKPSKKCNKTGKKRSTPIRGEFKCFQCPRVFPTLKGFQNHLECHKKVTCEICNLVYTKPHLKRHMMVHTGEKPFICDICGSGFADVTSMKDHQHVHSDVKKIQCELCDYRCKTVKRLRMHKVRHSTERKFQCDNCGARFLRNSDLKKHLLVHKDTFPFACANCSKRFKDKMHLRRHEETHTDQYKFQCPFCGKRMRQSGNLKTHLRTHNGEKPYKCEKCGQGFAHNVTKKQHQEQCRSGLGIEILIP